ncbi:MAG: NADPH:quinone reductase [Planctomycetota bacterium]|nr:NADPH:quinone reductase [Planctomycetota bacterium]
MKAAFIQQTGSPEVIQFGDLPEPATGDNQVRIRVSKVAVNPVDTYIRNGANYWELPYPFVIGCDFAGTVESVGDSVTGFQPGQRVWGTNQGLMQRQGTFAEWIAVDQEWVYPTPDGVDDESVAACSLVGITAHLGLFRDARIKAGDTIFVNGGTGGVGSMVVQMARAVGARVIATGGSDEKCELLKSEFGVDLAINYKREDVAEQVLAFAPEGVNVYWETVREPDFDHIVSILSERARVVLMAGRDARPEFPVGPFYVKGCSLHGFVMFKASPEELKVCAVDINRWLSEGKIKARVARRFDLSEAAAAHRLQEDNTLEKAGTIAGKIVLSVGS